MIAAENISKSFDGVPILENVNVEIEKGKCTVITGPSGSGKTTLLRAMSFLNPPDEGKILVNGRQFLFPSRINDFRFLYPSITVVYQQLFLWPHLTNRENITLAMNQEKVKIPLEEMIKFFSMEKFIDSYPNESSLGERQRVAIARALILEPEYIFFDEITSSLDNSQIDNIIALVEDLKKREMGIFVITHNDRFANEISDHKLSL